ncbi:MAG: aminopeptidase [Clostridia bacterium]|nr:aminopeptidase [Clostridia bacterium]
MDLIYKKESAYVRAPEKTEPAFAFAKDYMAFLNAAKTEREAADTAVKLAAAHGYRPYRIGDPVRPGDKLYLCNRGKSVYFLKIGSEPIERGMYITAAHIDSPRIDLKQQPLYESDGMAFFKTHYYGGLRKYQWVTIPLSLHGVVIRADGAKVEISVGEDAGDPVFYINDLLPHLAASQSKEPLSTAIKGEELNILCGSMPAADEEESDKIKLNVLNLLYERYGITEADFASAELSLVPATGARDVGFDRALIAAYGHDDRVCAYPALRALLDFGDENPHTQMCVLADKEEIGSMGVTGMQCQIFTDIMDEIAERLGGNPRVARGNSVCLSADVTAGYDPNFASVYEKRNSAIIGCGVAMSKFTGARGKSGTSDASAETVGRIRRLFDKDGVIWQTAELGKVDEGGGGTVAQYVANRNIDTLDVGVPVISMHAPVEVVSKVDVYSAYEAFAAFAKETETK